MNRAYRVVWSRVKSAWVVVSENTLGQGKSKTHSQCALSGGSEGARPQLRLTALATALGLALGVASNMPRRLRLRPVLPVRGMMPICSP